MNESCAIPYQHINEASTVDYNLQMESNSLPPLKYRRLLKTIAIIQLILAILAILSGSISFAVGINNRRAYLPSGTYHPPFNIDMSSVWIGILYVVTCSIGIGGFQNTTGHPGLIKSYFVLLIVSMILTPILFVSSLIWASLLSLFCNNGNDYNLMFCSFTGLNSVLFIISLLESKF